MVVLVDLVARRSAGHNLAEDAICVQEKRYEDAGMGMSWSVARMLCSVCANERGRTGVGASWGAVAGASPDGSWESHSAGDEET